jgi:hypothetical protein
LLDDSNSEQGAGGNRTVDNISHRAMDNHDVVDYPCTVVFCVKLEEDIRGWDPTSVLNNICQISGHNNSIATKMDKEGGPGDEGN